MSTSPPLANFPIRRITGGVARDRCGPIRCVRRLVVAAGLASVGGPGCVWEADDPAAYLQVVETSPSEGGTWPANAPLSVRFDRYLAAPTTRTDVVTLASGDALIPVGLTYDPVERALVLSPTEELVPGVGYLLTLPESVVEGLDGATLEEPLTLGFVAVAGGAAPPEPPVDFATQVRPLFEARCSCHGPSPATWPPLTPEGLVDVASRARPDVALVAPGVPLESGLVQKVLPGYPGLVGEAMPPAGSLSAAELRVLVDWVRDLGDPGR